MRSSKYTTRISTSHWAALKIVYLLTKAAIKFLLPQQLHAVHTVYSHHDVLEYDVIPTAAEPLNLHSVRDMVGSPSDRTPPKVNWNKVDWSRFNAKSECVRGSFETDFELPSQASQQVHFLAKALQKAFEIASRDPPRGHASSPRCHGVLLNPRTRWRNKMKLGSSACAAPQVCNGKFLKNVRVLSELLHAKLAPSIGEIFAVHCNTTQNRRKHLA